MIKCLLSAVAIAITMATAQAQSIKVTDKEGRGVPYATVLNTKCDLIGTTDLTGTLQDVKGANEVLITHAAYHPKQVVISSLEDGYITMEEASYVHCLFPETNINTTFYAETYYRAYGFANGSLQYYTAGIMPVAYNIKTSKVKTGKYKDSSIELCEEAMTKERVLKCFDNHFSPYSFLMPLFLQEKKRLNTLSIKMSDDGQGGQRLNISKKNVGYMVHKKNHTFISVNTIELFSSLAAAIGQGTMASMMLRGEKIYMHYTAVEDHDEDGASIFSDMKMFSSHMGGKYRQELQDCFRNIHS